MKLRCRTEREALIRGARDMIGRNASMISVGDVTAIATITATPTVQPGGSIVLNVAPLVDAVLDMVVARIARQRSPDAVAAIQSLRGD